MKWLKSTTDKSYTAQGKVIPPATQAPLAVTEDVYTKITGMAVIQSLIKTGGIIVLEKYTDPTSVSNNKLAVLKEENTKLQAQVKALEASEAKAKKFDELKAEAEQAIASKDAEIESLKAQLAEAQKSKKSSKKDEE